MLFLFAVLNYKCLLKDFFECIDVLFMDVFFCKNISIVRQRITLFCTSEVAIV